MAKSDKKDSKAKTQYDPEKDKVLKDLGDIIGTKLRAEVLSYDGGAPKLSVYRVLGKNKDKRRQVFRLPVSDVAGLAAFLNIAVDALDEFKVAAGEAAEE